MRDFCIIGLGLFGRILAEELQSMGHTVVGKSSNLSRLKEV